jgi:hypothetical protein
MPVGVTRIAADRCLVASGPGPGACGLAGWKALAGPVRPGLAGHSRLPAADCPGAVAVGDSEHAEAGQVDRSGKQAEVSGDLDQSADAGAAAAVAAAHQVADLAFDLGPGGPVVRLPGRVSLGLPGGGQAGLVRADGDRAAVLGGGALGG